MSEYAIFCGMFNVTLLAAFIAAGLVCLLSDRIEFWWKRRKAEKAVKKSQREEFGWIEILPDYSGKGELRTKIHWSK